METTLEPDQYVLVDKLTPRFDAYKRGDIVVFNPPAAWSAGERHAVHQAGDRRGRRHRRDQGRRTSTSTGPSSTEPYVFKEDDGTTQTTEDPLNQGKWVVPDGELFLMGDHRGSSADSREFGTVKVGDVIGRAWLRYWPIDTFEVLPTPSHPELASPAP